MKQFINLSVLIFFLLKAVPGYAQNESRKIEGIVLDDSGQPAALMSVSLEGSSVQTQTDEEGRFSIEVPVGSQTLVFSSVGFTPLKRFVSKMKAILMFV